MPLLRTVGRTAVIAGTASAVGGRVQHRQNEKWAAQEQQQYAQQAPPPAAAPAAAEEDPIEQLQKLGKLHEQGILTDEEFAAEKAKILNA
jgi:membrane protease subunit (stomatin/prohibitin family)